MRANRGRLVAACLTLCQAWIVAGRPSGGRSIGSYEIWAQTLGGVLEVAGVDGFLGNLDEMMAASDSEGGAWRAFIQTWWDRLGTAEVSASDLFGHARMADMPGADDLMMRIYAAMAQKERELISERTRAALAAAKARGAVLGGDRGYRPVTGPDAAAAAQARRKAAERVAHRLNLELERLRSDGVVRHADLARALTARGVPTPRGAAVWTHTTVARIVDRAARE